MRTMTLFFIMLFQMAALIVVILNDDFRIDMIIIAFQFAVLFFQRFVLPKIKFKDERHN